MEGVRQMSRRGAAAVAVLLAAGLLPACAPERVGEPSPAPTSDAPATSTPEPSETPTPTESAPAPIVIPHCAELIPLEAVTERYVDWQGIEQDSPQLIEVMRGVMGPVAQQALDDALQRQHCVWGIPHSDALIHVNVAELPPEVREELVAALQESDYAGSESEGVQVFEYELPGPAVGAHDIWYGFVGDVWVTSLGSGLGDLAVEGMLRANPELGGR